MSKWIESTNGIEFILDCPIYKIKDKISYSVFNYEGENNRHVLVITPQPLKDSEKVFFEKVLKAVSLEWRDIAIVTINNYPGVHINDLKKYFQPSKILLLQVTPSTLGLSIPSNPYIVSTNETISYLMAADLSTIEPSVDSKKLFWNALKQLFNVK